MVVGKRRGSVIIKELKENDMAKKKKTRNKKVRTEFKPLKKREKPYKPKQVQVLPPLAGLSGPQPKNLPVILDQTMMDSTSAVEISFMHNENYAPEIISNIMKPDHVSNLLTIRNSGDVPEFLKEGKKYIIDICRGIDSLETHTSMFIVLAMIQIGRILNEIFIAIGSDRSKYSKWVKENFGSQHTRYFQQSRQLLAMGEFATKYSSLGKNRLLQVDRIQDKDQYKEIIAQHPYPDITQDRKGLIFNEHTDAAATLYNLKQGGIDFADFDQAYLLSCFNKHWIEQKTVKKIKTWLDTFPTPEAKIDAFENYILNKMVFPTDREYQVVGNLQSLNTILSNLIKYYDAFIQQGQTEWKTSVNKNTFELARNVMTTLAQVTIPESPPIVSPAPVQKKQPAKSKKKEVK